MTLHAQSAHFTDFLSARPRGLTESAKIYSMLMVSIGVAALLLVQTACALIAFYILSHWVERKEQAVRDFIEVEKQNLAADLHRLLESPGPDQPSPLAVITDQFATMFAARVWQQIEARLRGAAGTVTREEGKQTEAEMAASSPLMALAMAFLPKSIKRKMIVNPQMLGALSNVMGAGGQPGGDHGNTGSGRKHRD